MLIQQIKQQIKQPDATFTVFVIGIILFTIGGIGAMLLPNFGITNPHPPIMSLLILLGSILTMAGLGVEVGIWVDKWLDK